MREPDSNSNRNESRARVGQTHQQSHRGTVRYTGVYVECPRRGELRGTGGGPLLSMDCFRPVKSGGRRSVEIPDFRHHPADMGVVATRFEDMITFPRIAPLQNLDGHPAYAPVVHFRPRGAVEIDGVAAGQGPSVIIDFVDLPG